MGSDATNKEVPKYHRCQNGKQEESCDVNVVFHLEFPFLLRVHNDAPYL